jgi:hypoxanthine phosphoribosyltransferase
VSGTLALTWSDFDAAVAALAEALRPRSGPLSGVYGVPRGGLPLAVALSHRLGLPLLGVPPPGVPFLWVDDVLDSGTTCRLAASLYPDSVRAVWVTKRPDPPGLAFAFTAPASAWVVFPWEDAGQAAADRLAYLDKLRGPGPVE